MNDVIMVDDHMCTKESPLNTLKSSDECGDGSRNVGPYMALSAQLALVMLHGQPQCRQREGFPVDYPRPLEQETPLSLHTRRIGRRCSSGLG